MTNDPFAVETAITVEGLTKRYGTLTALDGVSFGVARGEVFGCVGANGAGKTTAMRMLCGLGRPTSGGGTVAGYDIARQGERIKRHIGYMSQRFSLYDDLTVIENIRLYGGIYGLSRREILRRAVALLRRLDFRRESRTLVGALPLGRQQKLAFSVATLHRPEVVFLDELTTGLDVKARRDVWNLLDEMRQQGMTIVLTSHFMDEVEALCDRVIILRKGRIVFEGTVAEAVASGPFASFEDAYLAYAEPAEHAESVEAAEPTATAHFSEGGAHESL